MAFQQELSVAINMALQAGAIQQKSRYSLLHIDKKADASPVTDVDKACEELIRDGLHQVFPNDAFLGEENGAISGTSGRCWVVDPLDGTRPFIRNIPTYSSLISLLENDTPVVGVINLPALNLLCWASKGSGAFLNGQPIHVSSTSEMHSAMGSALGFVEHPEQILREKLLQIMRLWDYAYGFMDAFSYVCMASGRLDLCINLLDKPWDCSAAACIISEAGGIYSDIYGAASVHNGTFVISNGLLHKPVIEMFTS